MQFYKYFLACLCTLSLSFTVVAQTFYPANGDTHAPYDAQLQITFEDKPEIVSGSIVTIVSADGSTVDTIACTDDSQVFPDGAQVAVGSQLVRKDDKTIFITPHYGKLQPGKTYSVIISKDAIKGTFGGKQFEGITSGQWTFTTKPAPLPAADGATITVDNSTKPENTADFHSIAGALSFVENNQGIYTLSVAPGVYYELIHYKGTADVIIQGPKSSDRGNSVVIEYINCNDMNTKQDTRTSFFFTGANLSLENVTLTNLTERNKIYLSTVKFPSGDSQAEALFFAYGKGHTLTAYNCTFNSHQDTMQISGKCWFYNCAVNGDVDYVWGRADVALFENCDFTCINDSSKDRSYLFETRVGLKGNPIVPKGFVLFNSRVHVQKSLTAFFGRRATDKKRPTDYYDQCAIINTSFDGEGNVGTQRWYVGKEPEFIGDCSAVGWKEYNVSFKDIAGKKPENTDGRYKNSADINKKTFKSEFSTRDQIMNRVFNIDKNQYEADTENNWDINALARARGYTVPNLPKVKK
jgi:pectate lyase